MASYGDARSLFDGIAGRARKARPLQDGAPFDESVNVRGSPYRTRPARY
jgi:hypothetical protein